MFNATNSLKVCVILVGLFTLSYATAMSTSPYGQSFRKYFMSKELVILGVRVSGQMSSATYFEIFKDNNFSNEKLMTEYRKLITNMRDKILVVSIIKGVDRGEIIEAELLDTDFDATYHDGMFLFFLDEYQGRLSYGKCDVASVEEFSNEEILNLRSTTFESLDTKLQEKNAMLCTWKRVQ